MEKNKKNNTRMISLISIGVFVSAMILLIVIGINIATRIIYNQNLMAEKNRMEQEIEYIGDIEEYARDGYYVVYSDGRGYALDANGEIIVIYEMK